MLAIAGDLGCVGCIFTVGATVFFTFRDRAIARRMRTHSFLLFRHDAFLPPGMEQFRFHFLLSIRRRGSISIS